MDKATCLERGITRLGLDIPAEAQAGMLEFIELLAKWNNTFNLTAVRDPARMVTHHLLDSLAVLPWLHGRRVLDVGTGAGLPGIPLALASPEREFVLLDSQLKRIRFVNQAIGVLRLKNTVALQARVENFRATPILARGFDTVISRAFSNLAEFARAAEPLCAADGRLLAMKGVFPEEEIAQLPPGIELEAVHELAIPDLEADRHLLILRKTAG